jgi:predicted Rossmann fold nucleotide-binding protein DprA/Smf involved in DNA uptake
MAARSGARAGAGDAGRIAILTPGAAAYPAGRLHVLGDAMPGTITARGNLALLAGPMIGLYCSAKCPGRLVLRAFDLACALRDAGVTVVGGFHTPIERDCLAALLRGAGPVVICPARGVGTWRVPSEWRAPLKEGRLLFLSPFADGERRVTGELARERNRFVAALAHTIVVAHAEPGGGTEAVAREALAWGKPVLTLADEANGHLVAAGARTVTAEGLAKLLPGGES